MTEKEEIAWDYLADQVIRPGLCTQCGSCVGLSKGALEFRDSKGVPTPSLVGEREEVPSECQTACPARHCSYVELNRKLFDRLPENWLSGVLIKARIAHASSEKIRRKGASGGVITAMLIHLLETKRIKGAICLRMGVDKPYLAKPVIARTKEDIIACSQSVYSLTPVNTILEHIKPNDGPLAYVGLPDQVASIRKLQKANHPSVKNIRYVFGPYVGTQMYFESIRSFLRSNGIYSEREITKLEYRSGEWPGHLRIELKNGKVLKAEKFYYNYLIPFFITSGSLQLADFTNELTDVSVGDAWSPEFEKAGKGFSVVLTRSEEGENLMREMTGKELLESKEVTLSEALDMHGHMIDFKKRGSFLRMRRKSVKPDYGYEPVRIPVSRQLLEWCLFCFFSIGKTRLARIIVERLPLKIVGPTFNFLRKNWKAISKPTKRKGLSQTTFRLT